MGKAEQEWWEWGSLVIILLPFVYIWLRDLIEDINKKGRKK